MHKNRQIYVLKHYSKRRIKLFIDPSSNFSANEMIHILQVKSLH